MYGKTIKGRTTNVEPGRICSIIESVSTLGHLNTTKIMIIKGVLPTHGILQRDC